MSITDDVLLQLKVIASLSDFRDGGFRLEVGSGEPVIARNTRFSAISRFFAGESRSRTLKFVSRTYNICAQVVEMHLASTYLNMHKSRDVTEYQIRKACEITSLLSTMSKELESSLKGLTSLKIVYEGDHGVSAKIDLLTDKANRLILAIAQSVERTNAFMLANKVDREKHQVDEEL